MTIQRTALIFPPAMMAFAKAHGATLDLIKGGWGVNGDVPNALIRFIVAPKRTRDSVAETAVRCDCGCHMPNRNNARTGEAFWRCSSRRCHTKTRANYDRDSIGDTVSAAEPSDCKIDSAISSATSSATSSAIREVKFEDRNRTEAIVRRTVIEFGNKEAAIKWLQAKKVGLRGYGDTPLEAIKSVLGCTLVDALLDQRFET